jgi:protein-tyrosine phosphatase
MTFRLLLVCTGNICRSAFGEVLAGHLFDGGVQTRSAGLGAMVGHGMHPDSRQALAPWGLADSAAAENFRSRQLEARMVEDPDLILGATVEHRKGIVQLAPRGLKKAFTIKEFARLAVAVDATSLSADPWTRPRDLVEKAKAQRGARPVAPGEDDVNDPMGRPAAAHQEAARQIAAALEDIAAVLAGS